MKSSVRHKGRQVDTSRREGESLPEYRYRMRIGSQPRLPSAPEDFSERLEQAKYLGEYTILTDMEQPEFLRDLEQAVRDYERDVFHTDEVWNWAAREYRFDLRGERFAVGRDSRLSWLLIDDGNHVRLIVDGVQVSPAKKYELFFVAGGANASKRAADAVNRWNEMVAETKRV